MKRFADLLLDIDCLNHSDNKVDVLVHYFESVDNQDIKWAIALLSGKRPKRTITTSLLRQWATENAKLPLWLFEDSYMRVGDLAETIALLIPEATEDNSETLDYWLRSIIDLKDLSEIDKEAFVLSAWDQLDRDQRFVFNKLITGGLRVGVSQRILTQALAAYTGQKNSAIAYRLVSDWDPQQVSFNALFLFDISEAELSNPYPFYLPEELEIGTAELNPISEWQIERMWPGIRCQLIFRGNEIHIWTRGKELVSDRFPELHDLIIQIPHGTIIDGKIIGHSGDQLLPSNILQSRLGRKKVTKKLLQEAPVSFMAFDILEYNGQDIRHSLMDERRSILERIVSLADHSRLRLSEIIIPSSWQEAELHRLNSRKFYSGGLMLKRRSSIYQKSHHRGDWWKWKNNPLSIDAVLIYAERNPNQNSNEHTRYTFAVWNNDHLIPFTKASSGLTEAEIARIDDFVKNNTVERFGPVRSVDPKLVFQISFEGIQLSKRHKSGVSIRLPKIEQWKENKSANEANTLSELKSLLEEYG